MPTSRSLTLPALILSACFTLAACDSAEDRAEARFESALELIEAGDADRAIVELRSVFELNPSHLEARRTLANLLLTEKNNRQGAYSQFLRLAEQYPDDLDTRIMLGEIAFGVGNWDEMERHGAKAEELAPDLPRVQALTTVRAYRIAADGEDNAGMRDQARIAAELLVSQPESSLLRNVIIDSQLRNSEFTAALEGIDWMLERTPDDIRYWRQRLNVLARTEDFEAMETQLREMVTRFDSDNSHKTTLIRFYMARQQPDKAEAFLRELAVGDDGIGPRIDLIRFLTEIKGEAAGRAEAEAAIADYPDEPRLKVIGAGLDFTAGEQDAAIAVLENVIEDPAAIDYVNDVRVTLARMLVSVGNEVGARARIEETLAEDPNNPGALKMRAAWLIEADDTDGAIGSLRVALDSAPEDADAMGLMAQAYSRSGRPELARDFLALAVDASGNAPTETIRYARLLIGEERYLPAEDILLPALRLAPGNIELLATLGQLYLAMNDMGRVEQVARALRDLENEPGKLAANALEAERINRQSGPDAAIQYLEQAADSANATLASKIAVVRAKLNTGDREEALELARNLAADNTQDPVAQSVLASVEAVNGNLDTAESIYGNMLDNNPKQPRVWLEMSRIKQRQGEPDIAEEIVESGLAQVPGDPNLLWAKASARERNGDIEAAIAIYESLYEDNSNSAVVANNLASLLSTYREDAESLERAWVIARRLRDVEIPAFKDTYGWIAHRRGASAEALPYLETASKGLPRDPLVHYHLAETYRTLGRTEDALTAYRLALTVAGPADTRPQIAAAREQIRALETASSGD